MWEHAISYSSTCHLQIVHQQAFKVVRCPSPPNSNEAGPGEHQRNERLNLNIVGWNTKLAEHVSAFKKKHPDITIGIYDAHALFTKVLDNPEEYGFQDAYSYGGSDKYIWRDQLHPTSAMHKIIAADVAKFLTEFEVVDK
jgi:phospholipase/lecithinase/hemolysin